MARKKDLNLEKRLVLHAWMNDLFGYGSTRELLDDLKWADEGFDGEGRSGVLYRLRSRSDKLKLPLEDLERYDANVRGHLDAINHRRAEPITLRYFQHLAALYTELFLDRRFAAPETLVADLNRFTGGLEAPVVFEESDLNKLAFWMATGSGKTLLMHLNYLQFLFYNREPLDNVLLITPNEGLTGQHLEEMRRSGIPCERFSGGESGFGFAADDVVRVLEITKLKEEKRGQGVSVDVSAFEGRNLIFVDEGHKGAAGGDDAKAAKAWRPLRNRLAEEGFTFEYSATFGQAVQASKSEELATEYGKAILFDYSYRHFYEDGYGKDFRVLNLKNQTDEYTDLLLLGNLLSFYQQRRYYEEHRDGLKPYNLEPPLWVFVGSSVTKERGDVYTVTRFLQRFLKNEGGWSVETIEKLLGGSTGLQDGDGRDAFAGRFEYLKGRGEEARDLFTGVLREVFRAGAGGALHVADIKGSEGELGLKVAGAEKYFGLIFIGDTGRFKRALDGEVPGVVVEDDAFTGSLFGGIEDEDSPVNVLVGAKKFIEGWSSWRVSNMGLLNIGKSEGSQIIQLFGRGVRLKGRDLSLKRSSASVVTEDHPEHVDLLETLNIFAVQANYMAEFRKYLEREGVDPDGYEEIPFPIQRREDFLDEGLLYPKVPEELEFPKRVRFVLDAYEDVKVNLDLSAKVESTRMERDGVATATAKAGESRFIEEPYLSMLDWEAIHRDLLEYKAGKGYGNLILPAEAPRRIMEKRDPAVYDLKADLSLVEPETFAGFAELQDAVRSILQKYLDKFYNAHRKRWDSENMVLRDLTGSHPNFADYTVKVRGSEKELIDEVKALADRVDGDAGGLPHIFFDRHLYQPLLKDRGDEVKVSPSGLEPSEEKFVAALKRHLNGTGDHDKVFLLRNLSLGKGVGFFNTAGFYPDFILWVKHADGSQKVVFVEPHGMRNDDPPPHNDKVELYRTLRDLSDRLAGGEGGEISLDSYIVSATPYNELNKKWGGGWTRDHFARKHVLFEEDLDTRMPDVLAPRDELERRISSSYPHPLAHGYRALMAAGAPRELYGEQLRFAENLLAFLASVSLALLKKEDRKKQDLDLKKKWSGGVSPGDWKEIIQKCSKVFAGYEDVPPARDIHGLKIGTEQKGFGGDVMWLIRAKNDAKHDRGPKDPNEFAEAATETQEKLRRCLEALDFLTDHPIHEKDGGQLYLDAGESSVSLHPFIMSATCPRCEDVETYFVDAWNTRKGTARLKSFEEGHTIDSPEISDALESCIESSADS